MDNPQHYQPLSHALQPPLSQPSQYSTFSASSAAQPYSVGDSQREEEEEEEEEVVEEELDDNDRRDLSPSASPRNKQVVGPAATGNPSTQEHPAQIASAGRSSAHSHDSPEQKRRPGRPKGSRNRKPREGGGSVGKSQFPSYPMSQGGAPLLPGVTAQNQQYYEFQWRVLNLCSEFYGAAEELIKATPSLVIAQSYQMGPSSKVDPLSMLSEAKRICDQLLQNPVQLVGQPPPPVYPSVAYPPPSQSTTSTPATSTSQPSTVITNPSTFVMPLGMPGNSQPIYPTMYSTTPSRYPTAPYYQYTPGPGYYPTIPSQSATAPSTTSSSAPPATQFVSSTSPPTTSTLTMTTSNPAGASGAWTDEEVERLKRLAERSRTSGSSNETDWDRVVGQWGNSRTRHQILLKATALGLKESTTRGVKRRREGEVPNSSEAGPATAPPMGSLTNASGAVPSPSQSQTTTSTPSAQPSPAIHNPPPPPRPLSTTSTPTPTPSRSTTVGPAPNMPWPMPTVAANTSPVIAAAAAAPTPSEQRSANYYRQPRAHPPPPPPPIKAVPSTSHQYMYQPNGKSSK
ncbi:hypothetical protein B0F90DRAFT_1707409 [Multifurca ochricompacta]|uniref:Myb-like domain-containing protein n=1 Tax=Multifurca ochricompacta TaxID=376703 RepID=A0AAD4QPX3_9AGAM|nr:hypothetical protein B0F90DRAFT_1707409 [Multifurca ochricompacta]